MRQHSESAIYAAERRPTIAPGISLGTLDGRPRNGQRENNRVAAYSAAIHPF